MSHFSCVWNNLLQIKYWKAPLVAFSNCLRVVEPWPLDEENSWINDMFLPFLWRSRLSYKEVNQLSQKRAKTLEGFVWGGIPTYYWTNIFYWWSSPLGFIFLCLCPSFFLRRISHPCTFYLSFNNKFDCFQRKCVYTVNQWFLSLQGSILLLTPFFSRLIFQFQLRPQEFVTGMATNICFLKSLLRG